MKHLSNLHPLPHLPVVHYMLVYNFVSCDGQWSAQYPYMQLIFTPQLAGEARQLGCPKIVLGHVCVYIYIYVCTHHNA